MIIKHIHIQYEIDINFSSSGCFNL